MKQNNTLKIQLTTLHNFPSGNCNKMIKVKNDIVITAYRQVYNGLMKETELLVEMNLRSFVFMYYSKCCFWLYSFPLNY